MSVHGHWGQGVSQVTPQMGATPEETRPSSSPMATAWEQARGLGDHRLHSHPREESQASRGSPAEQVWSGNWQSMF